MTRRDWNKLVNRYQSRCAYCGHRTRLEQDHVVPISRGGQNTIGNILPACHPCNTSKRDDFLIYWRLGRISARRKKTIVLAPGAQKLM